jgi:regulatory protein
MESDDEPVDPATAADAYRRGLGLLVRREQSRRELTRKLAQRGIAGDVAAAAVDQLGRQGYQDDVRFAAAFARDRAAGGYGPMRIRQELAGHGLDRDQVEAALAACEADWPERATLIALRRFRPAELADPARRRKAVDFLIRRGFEQGHAGAAVRRAADGDPDA